MKKIIFLVFIFFISCSTDNKNNNNTLSDQDETFPKPEISIYPSNPVIGDVIDVTYQYSYPNVDSVVFNWVVGKDTIVENLQHLITTHLTSGVIIKCFAKVYYSDNSIKRFFSNEVVLSPIEEATIAGVMIGPDSVTAKDQVCLLRVDIVGDKSRLDFTINWAVNSNIISGATDSVLSLSNFKHGDQIIAVLKYGVDIEAKSNTILVTNSAPEIISMPPTSELTENGYQYQLMAQDADRDILVYSLLAKPESMTINRNTGLIQWQNPIEGYYNIQVEVIDNFGGKTSQQFNLRIGS